LGERSFAFSASAYPPMGRNVCQPSVVAGAETAAIMLHAQ
jgi:hypothetical protein